MLALKFWISDSKPGRLGVPPVFPPVEEEEEQEDGGAAGGAAGRGGGGARPAGRGGPERRGVPVPPLGA